MSATEGTAGVSAVLGDEDALAARRGGRPIGVSALVALTPAANGVHATLPGADENSTVGDRVAAVDTAVDGESPELLAGAQAEGIDVVTGVRSHVHHAIGDGERSCMSLD